MHQKWWLFLFVVAACSSSNTPDIPAKSNEPKAGMSSCTDGNDADCVPPDKTCGLGTSTACADGIVCQIDADCTSDYCDASGLCTPPADNAHSDGRRDAGETDVDCGGDSGTPCPENAQCNVNDDCESICNAGICAAPSDTDGKKNNGETDIDCGGLNAKKCSLGKACIAGTDCGLGYCVNDQCALPTSSDGVQNGTETDVDCGGAEQSFDGVTVPAAPPCALAKSCQVDTDCESTVCANYKLCVEAPSCRALHGGYSCGPTEVASNHESCCKTLQVPGLTMKDAGGVTKNVYVDKYEITSGRVRAWVAAIEAQYGGVPNIQAWVKERILVDPILAAMFPKTGFPASTGFTSQADGLPSKKTGQVVTFPYYVTDPNGQPTTIDLDMGLADQLGPTSYYRGVQPGEQTATSGCGMNAGAYGHRTYWSDATQMAYFGEPPRTISQDILDEKSMNCMTAMMFAAFCAWDGGYLISRDAISAAYGPKAWPWGDTPTPADEVAKIANYNAGVSNFGAKDPRYLFPLVDYGTFANDFTPIIAPPGRFPGDIASQARPAPQESWMDLGGNMLEFSQYNGGWYGWTGSSWEGHLAGYGPLWTTGVNFVDKYGKTGARCMRLY